MRDLTKLERYRDRGAELAIYTVNGDHGNGIFTIRFLRIGVNVLLHVIASNGDGWDHVSVSHKSRCPKWDEMEHVKRLFFEDSETVMQLHVPVTDHINFHKNCLHLWRPQGVEIPRPPAFMVML